MKRIIDIPRPEYPRPNFQRGSSEGIDWINLNGLWDFRFDPDDIGESEGWHNSEVYNDKIIVPYPWESLAAWGEADSASNSNYLSTNAYLEPDSVTCGGLDNSGNYRDADRHTIGWYRRTVVVPNSWFDQRIILKFGAVDWQARVWVNGQLVGENENGYLPFEIDITDYLVGGQSATLVVRAYDPQDHSAQPAGKQIGWYVRSSGIWQTVYLEPRSKTYIQDFKTYTDIDTAQVKINLNIAGGEIDGIGLAVKSNAPVKQTEIEVSGNQAFILLHLEPELVQLWDVDTPHLYDIDFNLRKDDQVIDQVSSYFGMRKVTRQLLPGTNYEYVFVNNRPTYLLGALNQSFTPEGVYTFLDDDQIKNDIVRAKEFGFNFLRLHIKIDEPRLYYWADKLGILFMCDIPNFGDSGYGELSQKRWEETLRGTIDRDFNHPSIIAWCDFNETWGLGYHQYAEMKDRQEWVRQMYHLTRELDPTRLAEDNSPCIYDHVETDLNTWHFYINDYQEAKDHIANVVEQTYPGSEFNYVGGNQQTNAPLLNSEYGGISAGSGDKDISWSFKFLTNEMRLYQKIGGYIYTELQDIEWEHNGFMNYDRSLKQFGYDCNDINALDFIAIDHHPGLTFEPGQEFSADVYSSHFSHKKVSDTVLHWRLDGLDHHGQKHLDLVSGHTDITFNPYKVDKVHHLSLKLPDQRLVGTLHIWVTDQDDSVIARNFVNVEVLKPISAVEQSPDLTVINHDFTGESLVVIEGEGNLSHSIELPDITKTIKSMELIFEASSTVIGSPQTDNELWPSEVKIISNGTDIDTINLPNSPADARGALSYINGIDGKYGHLVRVSIDPSHLDLSGGQLQIDLQSDSGGLTLYSQRAGRYPLAIQVRIHH